MIQRNKSTWLFVFEGCARHRHLNVSLTARFRHLMLFLQKHQQTPRLITKCFVSHNLPPGVSRELTTRSRICRKCVCNNKPCTLALPMTQAWQKIVMNSCESGVCGPPHASQLNTTYCSENTASLTVVFIPNGPHRGGSHWWITGIYCDSLWIS